jgi:hypothetical protein
MAAGAWGCQPYHLHVPIVLKSGSLNLLEPSEPVMGLLYLFYGRIPHIRIQLGLAGGWRQTAPPKRR